MSTFGGPGGVAVLISAKSCDADEAIPKILSSVNISLEGWIAAGAHPPG
jgi:hypothetical protein